MTHIRLYNCVHIKWYIDVDLLLILNVCMWAHTAMFRMIFYRALETADSKSDV